MNQPFSFDVSKFPPLPKLRGLFITGTDTGVGKTLVAGAIAAQLHERGRRVEVFKPAASGCRRQWDQLVSEDAQFLAACADSQRTLDEICPVRYGPALAPNVAAARTKRPVDLQAIFDAYRGMEGKADCVIVEGVGGLLCPITDDFWMIHMAKLCALPVVIVARAGLGTINHTLLTIHAARSAGLKVAGVVLNCYRLEALPGSRQPLPAGADAPSGDDDELAMLSNPDQIARLGRTEILAIVPDEAGNSVSKISLGPDTRFAISQGPWEKLL